jgi:hypothetical protein
MENIVMLLGGLILLGLGCFICFREKINLVHPYHFKRVAEGDRKPFCRGVGCGIILAGAGITLFPLLRTALEETAAIWISGAVLAIGLAVTVITIIKYNKGLF